MNLFLLDWCVQTCAAQHFDRHVVKMILELCQLLSTAQHELDPDNASRWLDEKKIYRSTHKNHPCAKWVREHVHNYRYTVRLGLALCAEYSHRYGDKTHATQCKLEFLRDNEPPSETFTDAHCTEFVGPHQVTKPAQAMPDEFRNDECTVTAYRAYYQSQQKAHLRSWKKRTRPQWFVDQGECAQQSGVKNTKRIKLSQ